MEWKNYLVVSAACAVLASAAMPASAAIVTTLFDDNFEAQTTGVTPGAPASGYGQYATLSGNAKSIVVAAGGTNAPSFDGSSNILRVSSAASGSVNRQRNFAAFDSAATGEGTVRLEFDARQDAGTTLNFGFIGNAGGAYTTYNSVSYVAPMWIQVTASAVQAYNATGGWQSVPGLTNTNGQWQHYVLEYELGSSSFSLTAGANSATSSRFFGAITSASELTHAYVSVGADNQLSFVDNLKVTVTQVPEPSSLAALGLAGLVLGRRRC